MTCWRHFKTENLLKKKKSREGRRGCGVLSCFQRNKTLSGIDIKKKEWWISIAKIHVFSKLDDNEVFTEGNSTFHLNLLFQPSVSKKSCFSTQLLKKYELLPPALFMFINVYSVYVEFHSLCLRVNYLVIIFSTYSSLSHFFQAS